MNIYQEKRERGAEIFVKALSAKLSKKYEIEILSAGKNIKVIDPDVSSGLFLRILHKIYLDPYSLRILFFSLSAIPLLNKNWDFVIPLNGGWQIVLVKLVQIWKKLRRVKSYKIIVSGQSGIGFDDWWNLRWQPDIFAGLSTKACQWAKEINPKIKIVYIPNGADTDKFKPESKRLNLPLERPIILCAAALVPYKRIDLIIKAVAKLKKGSLLVLGNGPLKEKIERLGKSLLGEKRFLRTEVAYEELEKYYASCDLFTLVSEAQEAFGNVIIEAMAMNKSVVASDDPIRREMVGEAGLFVDPKNTENYAAALEKALKEDFDGKPQRQAAKFSWEIIAEKYDSLLQETERYEP